MPRRCLSPDGDDRKFRYSVRHIVDDFEAIEWTRAATKHRVAHERARFVLDRATCCLEQDPPPNQPAADTRLMFFGNDEDGTPLEVIAVETQERRLLVIHVMQLRSHLRSLYEEAKRWQERTDIP